MTCRSRKSTAPARTVLPASRADFAEDSVSITLRKCAVLVRSRSVWAKTVGLADGPGSAGSRGSRQRDTLGGSFRVGAPPGSPRPGEVAPLEPAAGANAGPCPPAEIQAGAAVPVAWSWSGAASGEPRQRSGRHRSPCRTSARVTTARQPQQPRPSLLGVAHARSHPCSLEPPRRPFLFWAAMATAFRWQTTR